MSTDQHAGHGSGEGHGGDVGHGGHGRRGDERFGGSLRHRRDVVRPLTCGATGEGCDGGERDHGLRVSEGCRRPGRRGLGGRSAMTAGATRGRSGSLGILEGQN